MEWRICNNIYSILSIFAGCCLQTHDKQTKPRDHRGSVYILYCKNLKFYIFNFVFLIKYLSIQQPLAKFF